MAAHAPAVPDPVFAQAVREGLARDGQKELPCRYLYDSVGSALFEAITCLPEYGLTRADERLLRRHSPAIVERFCGPLAVAELGSGSGRKTRWILAAAGGRRATTYYPIDISPTALEKCRQELSGLRCVSILALESPYFEGLEEAASRRKDEEALLVLFLGSTIGNFSREAAQEFLVDVRSRLRPGDALLLGTDLVKSVDRMLLAYDDPPGVTAAFNRNLLARINRELGGNFVLSEFEHQARYRAAERRIEMHLVSRRAQNVTIRAAGLTCSFRAGESICTEACHKFEPGELAGLARRSGFRPEAQWIDDEWAFAENLWVA